MEAKALAGGQTFIPVLKQRLNKPSVVVDLAGLNLAGIKRVGDRLEIGAMTTHAEIAASPDVQAGRSGAGRPGRQYRRPAGASSRHHWRLARQ